MMRLLKIEWRKLRGHRFFWIGMGLFVVSMILLITQIGNFKIQVDNEASGTTYNPMNQEFRSLGFYKLPFLWHHITYLAGFFKFIPAFLLLLFVSNEYAYRTARQNVIDGLSRAEFYSTKILSALLFSLLSLATLFILGVLVGFPENDNFFSEMWRGSDYLLAYFLEVFFLMVFAIFLTILFRRSTISIIVIIAYYFLLEPILGLALRDYDIAKYLPTAPSRELILQPFTRLMNIDQLLQNQSPDSVSWHFLSITFLYTIVFGVLGFVILKKRDL